MPQSLSTIQPDFEDLVAQLQSFLSTKPVWKDQLTTATGQFYIELAAAIGELDQYSIQRVFEEMFPETARTDKSIYGAMKLLGTRLPRKIPASAVLPLTAGVSKLKRNDVPYTAAITIPAYTQFGSSLGLLFNREPILFDAGSAYAYQLEADNTTPKDVTLYQGTVEKRLFNATGNEFLSIISTEDAFNISDVDVVVKVDGVVVPRTTTGLWGYKDSKPAWQDKTTSSGQLHVLFGSDLYGTKPPKNSLIELTYVVTKGVEGNGVLPTKKISCEDFPVIDSTVDVFESDTNLTGGANPRSASDYKLLGSQLFASDEGEKLVLPQDYTAGVKSYPGVVDAYVLGQKQLDPADLRLMNAAKIITYPKLKQAAFADLVDYVNNKSMFSMNFFRKEDGSGNAVEPVEIATNIRANVYCSQNADIVSVRDTYIQAAIRALWDQQPIGPTTAKASRIARNAPLSDIYNAIKNAHPTIDYVELLEPTVNVVASLDTPDISLVANAGLGSLLAGTYHYAISVVTSEGETKPSSPRQILAAANDSVTLTWKDIPNYNGALYSGYKIYRGTVGTQLYLLASVTYGTESYVDTGGATTTAAPTADTTYKRIVVLPDTWNVVANIIMNYTTRTTNYGIS